MAAQDPIRATGSPTPRQRRIAYPGAIPDMPALAAGLRGDTALAMKECRHDDLWGRETALRSGANTGNRQSSGKTRSRRLVLV